MVLTTSQKAVASMAGPVVIGWLVLGVLGACAWAYRQWRKFLAAGGEMTSYVLRRPAGRLALRAGRPAPRAARHRRLAIGPAGRREHGVHGPPRVSARRRPPPPGLGGLRAERQDDRQALPPRGLPARGPGRRRLALDGPARHGEAPRDGGPGRGRDHGRRQFRLHPPGISYRARLPADPRRRPVAGCLAGLGAGCRGKPSRVVPLAAAGLAGVGHAGDRERPALAGRPAGIALGRGPARRRST